LSSNVPRSPETAGLPDTDCHVDSDGRTARVPV
jgi:hypothetical protein